jgi:hypothetical protein
MGKIIRLDSYKNDKEIRSMQVDYSNGALVDRFILERVTDPAVRTSHNVRMMREYLYMVLQSRNLDSPEKDEIMDRENEKLKKVLEPGEIVHKVKTIFLVKRCLSEWGINIVLGVGFQEKEEPDT